MSQIKSKTVIITGAAHGLGKALVFELVKKGYNLALLDIDAAGLRQLGQELGIVNNRITYHKVDITKSFQVSTARNEILKHHKEINMLINNAAISMSMPFSEVKLEDFRHLIDVNFWGVVYCTKYFIPDLKLSRNARIVNIVSDFAQMGFPGKTAYCSSKSAVMGFSNALRTELSDTDIKISLVIPPPMNTGLVRNGKHISKDKRIREAAFLELNGMPTRKAAAKIVRRVVKGKFRVIVGGKEFWFDLLARFFPSILHHQIGKQKKKFDFI